MVVYSGGSPTQQVNTGQRAIGEPYSELVVRDGQTCVIHGSSTVLYYKRRTAFSIQSPLPPQQKEATHPRESNIHQLIHQPLPTPEITVRLQMDEAGKFSAPYDTSVFRPIARTTDFFAWFGSQTGHGGAGGPPLLKFTFKDAMPVPKSSSIARLNEDHFRRMSQDIMEQFNRAKLYMPGLKEFVVLVTDPAWVSPSRE